MKTIVCLFNLKPDADRGAYEAWARERDLPTVNGLDSVERFEVLRSAGMLVGDGRPPYDYVEVIRVKDMDAFFRDVGTPAVQQGAAEFQSFADSPLFIVTESL